MGSGEKGTGREGSEALGDGGRKRREDQGRHVMQFWRRSFWDATREQELDWQPVWRHQELILRTRTFGGSLLDTCRGVHIDWTRAPALKPPRTSLALRPCGCRFTRKRLPGARLRGGSTHAGELGESDPACAGGR